MHLHHYHSLQVGGLISGIQMGMASGETGTNLITKNVLLSVTNTLVTSTGYLSISTPASQQATDSHMIQPKLTLGRDGLSACPFTGGYANLAVLQWTQNPFDNSKSVASPLLRMSSSSMSGPSGNAMLRPANSTRTRGRRRRSLSNIETEALSSSPTRSPIVNKNSRMITSAPSAAPSSAPSALKLNSARMRVPELPAYMVSLQFSSPQDFNFSASSNYTSGLKSTSNFSLPACVQFNGVKYVPCQGCNISSYTNYNVTYSCYDISQICPSYSGKRMLRDEFEPQHTNSAGGYIIDDYEGLFYEKGDDYVYMTDDYGYGEDEGRDEDLIRHLDALPVTDDGTTATPTPAAATYGMLVESIIAELTSVLSINPFTINLAQSKVILAFVGGFSSFIIIMLIFLLRLDHFDRLTKKYGAPDSVAAARLVIENRLKHGGKEEGAERASMLGAKVSVQYLILLEEL
jgi:hypothetical protein